MVLPWYGEISDYRYRLIDYVGDGFSLCASFGSAFHFTRGFRNSPNGGRLAGGVRAVRTNVPPLAGRGGAGLAVFWAVESGTCLARGRREDHWNSIAAGAATFGLFNARRGAPAATLFALVGAASYAGIAAIWWTVELWNSIRVDVDHGSPPLVANEAPCRTDHGAPADDSILYRSKNHGAPGVFAMEPNSEKDSRTPVVR